MKIRELCRLRHVVSLALLVGTALSPAQGQNYQLSPELAAKVATHPHVRQLTAWGGRYEWSADSNKLMFVSREYGDVFEMDVATGATRPLTFHFPHHGFQRAYYLANGDILLTGSPNTPFDLDGRMFSRWTESELWLLKADLSGPPIQLGARNLEGVAVSRNSMRIVWSQQEGPKPARRPDSRFSELWTPAGRQKLQLWSADISVKDGKPALVNRKMIFDCARPSGDLAKLLARRKGHVCSIVEPQNFITNDGSKLTITLVTVPNLDDPTQGLAHMQTGGFVLDAISGRLMPLSSKPGYFEPEGVFPGGAYTLVEHFPVGDGESATRRLDLWRLKLDGSGELTPVTRYNAIDGHLKSNQGVVSPDGKWLAFGVSTSELESKVFGGSLGIFLMNLEAAGLRQ